MAFSKQNSDRTKKYFFQSAYLGSHLNLKEWTYVTTDAPATVDGSGYIDDAEVIAAVDVGDKVWVYQVSDVDDLSSGITALSLHLVMSNTGTVVDLSDDLLGATLTDTD